MQTPVNPGQTTATVTPDTKSSWHELSPGLRVNVAKGVIEFDGIVPIDAHQERTPVVFLEWLVCTPDTKEHESLVMTKVKPSLIHAAMLSIGLEPGKPGTWDWSGKRIVAHPPTGPRVDVRVRWREEAGEGTDIATWVVNFKTKRTLRDERGDRSFVFSGSNIIERGGGAWYQADGDGGVVGLTCFSSELMSWEDMFNPDSGVEEPVWIANAALVPPVGAEVRVLITRK
jgi:hypothetical protein